jgi:hypothetical protein
LAKIISKNLRSDEVNLRFDEVNLRFDVVKIVLDKAESKIAETKPIEIDNQLNECVENNIWEADKMYLKICKKWCQF